MHFCLRETESSETEIGTTSPFPCDIAQISDRRTESVLALQCSIPCTWGDPRVLGGIPGLQPRTSGQAGEKQCWSEKEMSCSDTNQQNDRMRGKALEEGDMGWRIQSHNKASTEAFGAHFTLEYSPHQQPSHSPTWLHLSLYQSQLQLNQESLRAKERHSKERLTGNSSGHKQGTDIPLTPETFLLDELFNWVPKEQVTGKGESKDRESRRANREVSPWWLRWEHRGHT